MMTIRTILIGLLVVMSLLIVIPPDAGAEVLEIGTAEGKNGLDFYEMSSGFFLSVKEEHYNYSRLIFDGNLSTGLDHDIGAGVDRISIFVDFPIPLYVHNITVISTFNGSSTPYWFDLYYKGWSHNLALKENTTNFYHINCTIEGVTLFLEDLSRSHFYFNDVIINYTRYITNLSDAEKAIIDLSNDVDALEEQVNDINNKLDTLADDIKNITAELKDLYDILDGLNNSNNDINEELNKILENITSLWNRSITTRSDLLDLEDDHEELNATTVDKIDDLEDDLQTVGDDIDGITGDVLMIKSGLENGTVDDAMIGSIQTRLNNTISNIHSINENITIIKLSIPTDPGVTEPAYDDTQLLGGLDLLEKENARLKNDIDNLTNDIDDLNREIDTLESESEVGSRSVSLILLVIAIIICAILISMFFILFRKKNEPMDTPSPEFDVLNEIILEITKEAGSREPDISNDDIRSRLNDRLNNGEISREAFDISSKKLLVQNPTNYLPQITNPPAGPERKS